MALVEEHIQFTYNSTIGKGFIIDTTVRMERDIDQVTTGIDKEKKKIYEPCVPFNQNTIFPTSK